MAISTMTDDKKIDVRFPLGINSEDLERVDAVATRLGLGRSAYIRQVVMRDVEDHERNPVPPRSSAKPKRGKRTQSGESDE